MSQSERSPAPSLSARFEAIAAPEVADGRVPLRLTATRGALGIELYEPIEMGPLEVRALAATLPGLRFPLDLSGGVPVFRHRRGDLEHLELVVGLSALGSWLTPRLAEVVGTLERPVTVWSVPHGLGIGLSGALGALAFELLWAPLHGDARFVVANARAARLDAPALGHALRVVDTVLGGFAKRRGRTVSVPHVAAIITRALLPAIGARAPATERVRCGELLVSGDELSVQLDSTFEPPALHAAAARALELAEHTAAADDALCQGDLDSARAGYLAALEQAPRHPELARLVAEIDVFSSGRAEAALGMIVETVAATHAGWVGAELLARTGDLDGAREAIAEVARSEVFAPLSALNWQRMAELETGAAERLRALDRGVAAAPGLAVVRWSRFFERVRLGDVEASLADAEHLEAAANGARARHDVCTRAARSLLTHGFVRDAGRLFERALRYMPDDAAATAGLARSLMEAGKGERAFALLARAVALSERQGRADSDALIDMARLLATDLRDLPQAVARVRQVAASAPRAIEAAALEGEWRAALGDIAGATLAYARLRDRVELADDPPEEAAEYLLQAARFEREVQNDALAAERHLSVALRIAPRDKRVADAYREAAGLVAALARRDRERFARSPADESNDEPLVGADPAGGEPALATVRPVANEAEAEADERESADDIALAQRLEASVRANPDDVALVLELSAVFERLGRDHECHALLSGRLDESTGEDRAAIEERLVRVLSRLLQQALREGRPSEAELYQVALSQLGRSS